MAMTAEQTIEQVARLIARLYDDEKYWDGLAKDVAIEALSSLRPGDVLPGGMVVVRIVKSWVASAASLSPKQKEEGE